MKYGLLTKKVCTRALGARERLRGDTEHGTRGEKETNAWLDEKQERDIGKELYIRLT